MEKKFKYTTLVLWAFLGLLLFLSLRGLFSPQTDFTRSHVILITADSLRPDHLTSYGYPKATTPHLNALASDAAIFYYTFAQSSHSGAAAASIFSAQTPLDHGVTQGQRVANPSGGHSSPAEAYLVEGQEILRDETQTLAEDLLAAGYTTAGFSSSGFLTKALGFAQGFSLFEDFQCRWGTAECISREASQWLEKDHATPFFLWIHYNDLMDDFPVTGQHHSLDPKIENPFPAKDENDPEAAAVSRYDAKLAYLDREMGKVIRRLQELGLYENAFVAVMGVHGEELGEHGGWGHGTSVYNEQIHVPLIIKLPHNWYKGSIIEQWVRQADIAPTILEVVKAPPLNRVFGVSLVPDIQNIGASGMEIYTECRANGLTQAVLERKYKLMVRPGTGEKEFYNIQKDFRERKNIVEKDKLNADQMYRRIKEHFSVGVGSQVVRLLAF